MNSYFKMKGFIYDANWIVEKLDEKGPYNLRILTRALWLYMESRTRPLVKRSSGCSGSINGSCVYKLAAVIGKYVFHGLLLRTRFAICSI
jgi:hypothetical protein